MAGKVGSTLRLSEYRGCGIRAFSYQGGSGDWVPEACCWLCTAAGWRRLWTKSFERFFVGQDLTFPSQKAADDFAFRLARRLIDQTLTDLEEPISPRMAALTAYFSGASQAERGPFSIAGIFRGLRNRG